MSILNFTKKGRIWRTEFEANAPFALDIVRKDVGYVRVYLSTTGEEYELKYNIEHDVVCHEEFNYKVYPKMVRVDCTTEPTSASVTFGKASSEGGESGEGGGGNTPTIDKFPYYIGHLTSTKSAFETLEDSYLTALLDAKEGNGKENNFIATKNCFVMLVPEDREITKCEYSEGGVTTSIVDNNLWNLSHTDIEIDGTIFNVYGYRFNGISEEDPLVFIYNVK